MNPYALPSIIAIVPYVILALTVLLLNPRDRTTRWLGIMLLAFAASYTFTGGASSVASGEVKHKLVAVFSADAVGYSRLMAEELSETGSVHDCARCRREAEASAPNRSRWGCEFRNPAGGASEKTVATGDPI